MNYMNLPTWIEYAIYTMIFCYCILIPKLAYDFYKEIKNK